MTQIDIISHFSSDSYKKLLLFNCVNLRLLLINALSILLNRIKAILYRLARLFLSCTVNDTQNVNFMNRKL